MLAKEVDCHESSKYSYIPNKHDGKGAPNWIPEIIEKLEKHDKI